MLQNLRLSIEIEKHLLEQKSLACKCQIWKEPLREYQKKAVQCYCQFIIRQMTQTNPHLRNLTFNQTFDSSLTESSNQKFLMDKSLVKGIKQNDAGKIIDQNQLGGVIENLQGYSFVADLAELIKNRRKVYDQKKAESVRLQNNIQKLKEQKQALLNEQNKYSAIISNIKKQYSETSRSFQDIASSLDAVAFRRDIYSNRKDTTKHDILVLKKRHFDLDVRLIRNSSKLKTIRTEHQLKIKLSKRYRELLDSVSKTVHSKQVQSRSKIKSFCDAINRKQNNKSFSEKRDRQSREVMISAMTDKHIQQKQWIRVLNVNKLLRVLLRKKMQKLMLKFTTVQFSFHKMKQATSIKTSRQFIQRFVHRQQTYGLLLTSISDKEKLLQSAKEEKQQLQKIYHYNRTVNQQINQLVKNQIEENIDDDNNIHCDILHQLNQSIFTISRNQQMMYQWGVKFLATFNSHETRNQIIEQFPKNLKKQLMIQALLTISKFIDNLKSQQNYGKKVEASFFGSNLTDRIMSDEMLQKNVRVKVLPTNSVGRLDSLQKDFGYDDLSQADYLNHSRKALKKSEINKKFRIKAKAI